MRWGDLETVNPSHCLFLVVVIFSPWRFHGSSCTECGTVEFEAHGVMSRLCLERYEK